VKSDKCQTCEGGDTILHGGKFLSRYFLINIAGIPTEGQIKILTASADQETLSLFSDMRDVLSGYET
jgi:hypothetical protein